MNNSTCSRRSLVKGMAGAAAFAIVGGLGLAGCGYPAAKADGSAPSDAAFKIGVLQLTEHPALDAANKGFVAAGEEAGIGANSKQQTAQHDQSACQPSASTLVNEGGDLILAIATPSAQAVAGATSDIPIHCTAITDFAAPGVDVTCTSDMNPVFDQFELLLQLAPEAKYVGLLYCTADYNS